MIKLNLHQSWNGNINKMGKMGCTNTQQKHAHTHIQLKGEVVANFNDIYILFMCKRKHNTPTHKCIKRKQCKSNGVAAKCSQMS